MNEKDFKSNQPSHVRYLARTPMEASLQDALNPLFAPEGLVVVRVRIDRGQRATRIVQMMIEHADGRSATLSDCERMSRIASAWLDVHGPLNDHYMLEMSSAGLDRPLMQWDDFVRFAHRKVAIQLTQLVHGAKRWRGVLQGVDLDCILLKVEPLSRTHVHETNDMVIHIPFDSISTAHLWLDDSEAGYRKRLSKDKKKHASSRVPCAEDNEHLSS